MTKKKYSCELSEAYDYDYDEYDPEESTEDGDVLYEENEEVMENND